jgi:hypothetical protein
MLSAVDLKINRKNVRKNYLKNNRLLGLAVGLVNLQGEGVDNKNLIVKF